MAYDVASHNVVLFGGQTAGGDVNDTWIWNGTTWTERYRASGPPARDMAYVAYDAAAGTVLLFGGTNNGSFLDDTWNGTWTEQQPANTPGRPVGWCDGL
jgi:hypothetical protein